MLQETKFFEVSFLISQFNLCTYMKLIFQVIYMDKVHVLCVKFKFINVFLSSEFLFIKFLLTSILDYQNKKLCCHRLINRVEQNQMKNSVERILWLIVADGFVIIAFVFFVLLIDCINYF